LRLSLWDWYNLPRWSSRRELRRFLHPIGAQGNPGWAGMVCTDGGLGRVGVALRLLSGGAIAASQL
jgi:hypothetical protein